MITRERPIIFSAPMVRAILDGRKSQTRRVVKDSAWISYEDRSAPGWACEEIDHRRCPYGAPGDRLWVREAFIHEPADYCWEASTSVPSRPAFTIYRADSYDPRGGPWKSPIYMPRSLSRITLEVTGVRVERLQAISEADAVAEGMEPCLTARALHGESLPPPAYSQYADLWESINGPGSWDDNPWVWVVEFRRATP